MKVPGGANVNRSLIALRKSLKGYLKQVNQQVVKLLAKGDYSRAETLVQVVKSVDAFHGEVENLHSRWKGIKGEREEATNEVQTPLWEYYQPILQALDGLGGAARIVELEQAVGHLMDSRFAEGDLRTMARGRPRWQIMIRRARKHMVKEGLLEADTGLEWRITSAGLGASASGKDTTA